MEKMKEREVREGKRKKGKERKLISLYIHQRMNSQFALSSNRDAIATALITLKMTTTTKIMNMKMMRMTFMVMGTSLTMMEEASTSSNQKISQRLILTYAICEQRNQHFVCLPISPNISYLLNLQKNIPGPYLLLNPSQHHLLSHLYASIYCLLSASPLCAPPPPLHALLTYRKVHPFFLPHHLQRLP